MLHTPISVTDHHSIVYAIIRVKFLFVLRRFVGSWLSFVRIYVRSVKFWLQLLDHIHGELHIYNMVLMNDREDLSDISHGAKPNQERHIGKQFGITKIIVP